MCVLRVLVATRTQKSSVAIQQLDDVVDDAALQRHNPSLVVEQHDGVVDDAALQRPSSSTASSLGNLMVSWMSFAASVPTYDGPVTLIGPKKTPEWQEKHSDKEIQKKERHMTHQDTMLIIRYTPHLMWKDTRPEITEEAGKLRLVITNVLANIT